MVGEKEMINEQTKYVLVQNGRTDFPIQYGGKTEICEAWCRKRYQDAPDEEFSVIEVKLIPVKELTKTEIEDIVEEYYKEY
jgi:hypothetical protein